MHVSWHDNQETSASTVALPRGRQVFGNLDGNKQKHFTFVAIAVGTSVLIGSAAATESRKFKSARGPSI